MTTAQKLLFDRIVGTPLAWAANVAARMLGKLLRRDHSTEASTVRRIVVQKILGLGSVLQATPLLAALRRAFPDAEVILITSKRNRALVERLPLVNRGLYIDDTSLPTSLSSALTVAATMARTGVDLFFDLELYSAAASVLATSSRARNRYGFYRHSARFKQGSYTHLVKFTTNKPIARLYMQLGLAAGAPQVAAEELGPLTVYPEDSQRLAETLRRLGQTLQPEYIVLNPNASDLMLERRWPAAAFASLLESLTREDRQCVLVGNQSEAAYVGALLARLSDDARARVIDTAGQLSFGELLALMGGARCVVTNDTGPMHISFALRRPTVCLFGPVDPVHYGCEAPNVETLYAPVFCSPCVHENEPPPCAGNNICMQLIEPDEVLQAVHRVLGLSAAPRRVLSRRYLDQSGRALGIIAQLSLPSSLPGGRPKESDTKQR